MLAEDNKKGDFANVEYALKCLSYESITWSKKIATANGLLNPVTGEFSEFTLDEIVPYHIPVAYDKTADCPRIKKFLLEVFGEAQLSVVQEVIGYCLLRAMPFHKAVMLVGSGSNGKSSFLNLQIALLGAENVSNVSLQELANDRFASANLYQKLANISADLPQTAIANSGRFKMLTGGDRVYAQHKYGQPFEFQNTAKLMFSANQIPEVKDDTLAFFRRWIILNCNTTFLGPNCNPHLLAELITPQELSGLLNFALSGLQRLLCQGHFSVNETIESLRTEYIRKSNSAKAYIEEELTFDSDPKAIILEVELYRQYVLWCETNLLPAMAKASFTKNMQQYQPQAKQTTTRIDGKAGVHIWQYIKISSNCSDSLTRNPTESHELEKGRVAATLDTVLCSDICRNYGKPPCPWFTKPLPPNAEKPLKCYGYMPMEASA